MFVGPLEARKIIFVVSYNQGYKRMRGVWRRMQICMHIWGYIFWLSWQCSNWCRSVASSRMNLTQISFRFVFDWKTHSQAFRKHLKHLKLKFRARKYAYANFCGNMPKGVWKSVCRTCVALTVHFLSKKLCECLKSLVTYSLIQADSFWVCKTISWVQRVSCKLF